MNNNRGIIFRKAEEVDIPSIINLNRENLRDNLTEQQKGEGFLEWCPTEDELKEMVSHGEVLIGDNEGGVGGYFIALDKDSAFKIPFHKEMLSHAETLLFKGRPIRDYGYVVLAQVCIAKEFRGTGLLQRLYQFVGLELGKRYEIGICEIADGNKKSLEIHKEYTEIGRYTSQTGTDWHIMIANIRKQDENIS